MANADGQIIGMAEHTFFGRRWVWDLYPLRPDAWSPTVEEPGNNVGKVIKTLHWNPSRGPTKSDTHEGYMPTDDDLDAVKFLYPDDDEHKPHWHKIAADLVAAGNDPKTIHECTALMLLGYMRKLKSGRRWHFWNWLDVFGEVPSQGRNIAAIGFWLVVGLLIVWAADYFFGLHISITPLLKRLEFWN